MGLIQESQKKVIRQRLGAMKDEVSIVYFTQDVECAFCRETREILQEVSGLSDRLSLQVFDFQLDKAEADKYKVDKIPAIVIRSQKDYGIRYYGVPAGYEFSTFLDDLVMVSHGNSGLSDRTRTILKAVSEPVHIQVFVTPT